MKKKQMREIMRVLGITVIVIIVAILLDKGLKIGGNGAHAGYGYGTVTPSKAPTWTPIVDPTKNPPPPKRTPPPKVR